MLLDRVLRLTVRNFSTLFLVVFIAIIPLHLIYAFVFHDVFAVRELHPAIAEFPENRLVRGVGRADISLARIGFWVVAAIEVGLIPFVTRAMKRVLVLDRQGEVPEASSAWRTWRESSSTPTDVKPDAAATAGAIVTGLIVGLLVWLALDAVVDLLRGSVVAFGLALADAASRAAGAAFALTPFALQLQAARDEERLKL